MRTTIDAAGRIVVPKPLRDQLGLTGGQELEIVARDGRLEVEFPPTALRLERRGPVVVAVPDVDLPVLTAGQVRETLERSRR
jgi:AbrB family looped-hinge helix DNA binding protein